jgi:hypothetical protein
MANPNTWQAPTSGQQPRAAHVSQLLGPHALTMLYAGNSVAAQTTAGSGSVSTNGLYLAQSFTTGTATSVGYVVLGLTPTTGSGSQLATTTVSLYANTSGAPSGAPIVSTTVTAEYAQWSAGAVTVPLPAAGLTTSTTYWIVIAAAGNASFNYGWAKSNQVSGASTSANGTNWTAQSYGLLFQVFDQTLTGQPTCVWEDSGARWTWTGYTTAGEIAQYAEYTAGQTTTGYVQSARTFAYSSGLLTTVA